MAELWLVRGGHPVLWTIPAHVWWHPVTHAHVTLACNYFPQMREAMERRLVGDCRGRQERDGWIVHGRKVFQSVAIQLPEKTDPQSVFSWERPRRELPWQMTGRWERDEFLDALYQRGVGSTRAELTYWWNVLCSHMLDWLVNEDRPVDLYFAKIQPMALRMDWCNMTFASLASNWGKLTERKMREPAFMDELTNEKRLAYTRTGQCERHLEIEHADLWWKLVNRVERERLQKLGPAGYAREFMQSVRRSGERAIKIFRQWYQHRRAPAVKRHPEGFFTARHIRPPGRRKHVQFGVERDGQAVYALEMARRRRAANYRGKREQLEAYLQKKDWQRVYLGWDGPGRMRKYRARKKAALAAGLGGSGVVERPVNGQTISGAVVDGQCAVQTNGNGSHGPAIRQADTVLPKVPDILPATPDVRKPD